MGNVPNNDSLFVLALGTWSPCAKEGGLTCYCFWSRHPVETVCCLLLLPSFSVAARFCFTHLGAEQNLVELSLNFVIEVTLYAFHVTTEAPLRILYSAKGGRCR
jgi:hypothetical protein